MKGEKVQKKNKWLKYRHRIVRNIAYSILAPYSRWKFGFKAEKFREQENRPYLIMMNHQTSFDQFFVGMAFRGPVYYLASEDIFSNGFVSSLIRFLVAPIPIKKQTTDLKAIKTCIRVAKEGGTIAIAPEGNRTYSGRTVYMSPAIAFLARKLGMPIVIYRIEGGYGVQPRWSDVVRRGKMRGYVSKVIYPDEYASMSDNELFKLIRDGLYVDEAVVDKKFYHKRLAEYLERAIYVCPHCGLSEFESNMDIIKCKRCNQEIRYLPTKELQGVGNEFPYRFVADWYDAQTDFVNALNVLEYTEKPMYSDKADLYEVVLYKKKKLLSKDIELSLYGDRVEISHVHNKEIISFDEAASITVLGRNKLNIYIGDKIYQIKGDKRFNALKYVHIYHRYKNMVKVDSSEKFLGL